MAQFATEQQFSALFPTIATGKEPGQVSQLISIASSEAERLCRRTMALTLQVEQSIVESGGMGTGRAMGGLGFAAVRADLPFYESWSPTTIFLREYPIAEMDKLTLIYPHGGQGDLALDGILLNGDEGWFQLPMGVYCPERTVAQAVYWAGFAQTKLAVAGGVADQTITVDDARGITLGKRLRIMDFSKDEDVQVTAQPVPGSGQSVLQLARPLAFGHALNTPVWAVPEILSLATCYLVADYLSTGSWPTNVPGGAQMIKSGDLTMSMRGTGTMLGGSARGPLGATAYEILKNGGLVRAGM